MNRHPRYLGWLALGLAAVAFSAREGHAAQILFDFEGSAGTPFESGALTSLPLNQSGLTLTLSRENATRFDITNTNGFGFASSFGTRTLDPFFNSSAAAFLGNLSQMIDSVSIDMGDFGQDTDTLLLQAFSGMNATGTLLATATATLIPSVNTFSFLNLSVSATGINSIRFIGGSSAGPNSVFYDNILVNAPGIQAVPEPATFAMASLAGFLGIGASLLRCRRRQAAV